MSLLHVLEQYDLHLREEIQRLREENDELRRELGEATAQMVQMSDLSSRTALNAALAGVAIATNDAGLKKSLLDISNACNPAGV